MRHVDFLRAIRKGQIAQNTRLFLFFGEERYLMREAERRVQTHFGLQERRVFWVDETPWQEIRQEILAPSFFGGATLYVIRRAELVPDLPNQTPAFSQISDAVIWEVSDLRKAYRSWLNGRLPRTLREDQFLRQAQKRFGPETLLVSFPKFGPQDEKTFRSWVQRRLKEAQVYLDPAAMKVLWALLPRDLERADRELQKLILIGQSQHLTADLLRRILVPIEESDVFALLDALLKGDSRAFFVQFEKARRRGESPYTLIALLSQALVDMLLVKLDLPIQKPKFVVQKYTNMARMLTPHDIHAMLQRVVATEKRMKSKSLNTDFLVQHVLTELVWKRSSWVSSS